MNHEDWIANRDGFRFAPPKPLPKKTFNGLKFSAWIIGICAVLVALKLIF